MTLWLFIVSVVLLAVIITNFTRSYIRKKKNEIEERVIFAQQLQEQIWALENSRDSLKQNLSQASSESSLTRAELEEKKIIIKKLLSSKYELLEELCQITIENNNTPQLRRKIADKVTALIEDISIGNKTITLLEKQVDETYNNLMSDLRTVCPELKEKDYRIYLFSVLGFSTSVISMFLKEEKINSVYNRKRRLKDKLKELPPKQYERFAALIN